MTTIREKSTAALAEALFAADHEFSEFGAAGTEQAASMLLAASPTIASRLDFATAWDEAVAALPEGSWLSLDFDAAGCKASAYPPSMVAMVKAGRGPTPTDALVALTEKLREAQR